METTRRPPCRLRAGSARPTFWLREASLGALLASDSTPTASLIGPRWEEGRGGRSRCLRPVTGMLRVYSFARPPHPPEARARLLERVSSGAWLLWPLTPILAAGPLTQRARGGTRLLDWGKSDLVQRRSCPGEGRHGHPCGRQTVWTQVLPRKAVDSDPGSSPANGDIISVTWEVLLFPSLFPQRSLIRSRHNGLMEV